MRSFLVRHLVALGLVTVGGSAMAGAADPDRVGLGAASRRVAARVADVSRTGRYDDFVRVVWPAPGGRVDQITFGRRAFFTATTWLEPEVTVDELLDWVGNYPHEGRDLAVMRCRPSASQRRTVEPILATWPNVFPAIAGDLAPGGDCASADLDEGERYLCELASGYRDRPVDVYGVGLADALDRGAAMFATEASRRALSRDFGIYPPFSGLGFAIRSSADEAGNAVPLTTAAILRNAVVPEYLLKNALLADAGCHCLQVPDSPDLTVQPVDLDHVWQAGALDGGACRKVQRLDGPVRP